MLQYTFIEETQTYMVGKPGGTQGNGCQGTCPSEIHIDEYYNGYKVTAVAENAFQRSQVTKVTLPNSITHLLAFCFDINSINEIIIPPNVEELGSFCFATNKFQTVTIPRSVKIIGNDPFGNNENLESIIVEEGNDHFCTDLYGSLMTKNQTVFILGLPNIEYLSIPPTVHTILTQSMDGFSKYKQIIIHGDIKHFNANAINSVTSLEEIYYFGKTPIPSNIMVSSPTPRIYVCNDYENKTVGDIEVILSGYCYRPKTRCFTQHKKPKIFQNFFLFQLMN